MKLFKRLMTALLAGVLAMGMLAGCSGAPAAPNTPLPNDAEALALYQGVSETCKKYNVKTPVYCAELEPIAQEIAKAAVIHRYYTTQPSAAVINKAKMDVSALMDGGLPLQQRGHCREGRQDVDRLPAHYRDPC